MSVNLHPSQSKWWIMIISVWSNIAFFSVCLWQVCSPQSLRSRKRRSLPCQMTLRPAAALPVRPVSHHTNRIPLCSFFFSQLGFVFLWKAKCDSTLPDLTKPKKQTSPLFLIISHTIATMTRQTVLLVRTVLLLKQRHVFYRSSLHAHPCTINTAQLRALQPDSSCPQHPHPEEEGSTLWAHEQTEVKSPAHPPSQRSRAEDWRQAVTTGTGQSYKTHSGCTDSYVYMYVCVYAYIY